MDKLMDWFASYFFGWYFPLLSTVAAGLLWIAWKRGNASPNWPTTQGEVLRSEVQFDEGGCRPKSEFRYWVNEKEYHRNTSRTAAIAQIERRPNRMSHGFRRTR
jgi:hypothetical protein